MYGQDTNYWMFDYGKKFFEAYPDNNKYLQMAFMTSHEASGHVLKTIDDNMLDFLQVNS